MEDREILNCIRALVAEEHWLRQQRDRGELSEDVEIRRLSEVEIHHVDLAAGYAPSDWPADFVADALPRVAGSFAGRDDAPCCLVWAESAPHGYRIGPADPASPPVVVHGPPADLLAWLLGRDSGAGLRVSGQADGAPVLPAWR